MSLFDRGQNRLKWGTWNALCDRCGWKYKAEDLREEWNGLRVCPTCYEPRHPQDFQRAVKDDPSVPWARPDDNPDDSITYRDDTDITISVGDDFQQVYNTDLTANRTVTINTTGASEGDRFRIVRSGGGSFTLDVNGLKTIPAGIQATVEVVFEDSKWKLDRYWTHKI